MLSIYQKQKHESFYLWMGLTYQLLHTMFGVDMGERFHMDIRYRLEKTMEIDREVYRSFRKIGIGYEDPFPRASIEPFGHYFIPVMYGCEPVYGMDANPCVQAPIAGSQVIEEHGRWSPGRFERSWPVREIISQVQYVKDHVDRETADKRLPYNPHYSPLSGQQNLGSVINNAFVTCGQNVLTLYLDKPGLLKKIFKNINSLMLHSLKYFSTLDGKSPANIFVGNCLVSMISPDQYMACNYEYDRQLARFARNTGAGFLVHQDSDASPHLANYSRLAPVHTLDLGQDSDFEEIYRLFPESSVNCILFPFWVQSHSSDEIREELNRIMKIGRRFPSFTFTLFEIDEQLARGKIFEFYEDFRYCAAANSAS